MICMVCGETCKGIHGRSVEYPDELIEVLFGKKNNYAVDLDRLNTPKMSGAKLKQIYGKDFYEDSSGLGITAVFRGKEYHVALVDPRLVELGVQFYGSDNIKLGLDGAAGMSHLDKEPSVPVTNIDDVPIFDSAYCIIFGKRVRLENVIPYVIKRIHNEEDIGAILIELFADLKERFYNDIERRNEVSDIEKKCFVRNAISIETALLLVLSYYPNASAAGESYKLPILCGASDLCFVEKTQEEFFRFMEIAAHDIYPQTTLHRMLLELVREKAGRRPVIYIIAWNIFLCGKGDSLFESRLQKWIEKI